MIDDIIADFMFHENPERIKIGIRRDDTYEGWAVVIKKPTSVGIIFDAMEKLIEDTRAGIYARP